MEAAIIIVYMLIAFILVELLGGTMIGYYFQKKYEYEARKFGILSDVLKTKKEDKTG